MENGLEKATKTGDPNVRVWDGSHNPYNEINSTKTTYGNIVEKKEYVLVIRAVLLRNLLKRR